MDVAIAVLASRQHGVIAHPQLVALGLSQKAVKGRIARGWLHPSRARPGYRPSEFEDRFLRLGADLPRAPRRPGPAAR